jgi:hypothetical protein
MTAGEYRAQVRAIRVAVRQEDWSLVAALASQLDMLEVFEGIHE